MLTVGCDHVMSCLSAAVESDHRMCSMLPSQIIDNGALPLISIAQPYNRESLRRVTHVPHGQPQRNAWTQPLRRCSYPRDWRLRRSSRGHVRPSTFLRYGDNPADSRLPPVFWEGHRNPDASSSSSSLP